jgi:hypothetical protein
VKRLSVAISCSLFLVLSSPANADLTVTYQYYVPPVTGSQPNPTLVATSAWDGPASFFISIAYLDTFLHEGTTSAGPLLDTHYSSAYPIGGGSMTHLVIAVGYEAWYLLPPRTRGLALAILVGGRIHHHSNC